MKICKHIISITVGAVALTSSLAAASETPVSTEVMTLLYQDANQAPPAPPTEAEESSRWYASAALGASFLLDTEIKETNGPKFKFKTGLGLNLGVGYILTKNWAVEVRSGVLWNEIDEYQGTSQGVSYNGGDGTVYQIPLMASAVYSIPISDKFSIGLKAGIGLQWTDFSVDRIRITAPRLNALGSLDKTSTSFRWEVGFQLANQIAHNIRIGGGVIFSGSSSIDVGSPMVDLGGTTEVGLGDKLDPLYNISLGFGVNIRF